MTLEQVVGIVALLWPVAEIILGVVRRAKRSRADVRDRGSMLLLWMLIVASIMAGAMLRGRAAALAIRGRWALDLSLVLLVAGLAIRAAAILTLGRFFTSNVAIQSEHRVVHSGLYRYIRHPSYLGALLAFVGLGFFFRNWLSVGLIVVATTAAFLYRMKVEETALIAALGDEYIEYRHSTKRLLPGIY